MEEFTSTDPCANPRDRKREDNDVFTDGWGFDGQLPDATPYQVLCAKEYSVIDVHSRPSPHEFLTHSPEANRATWKVDKPIHLSVDVRTDSAIDIMRKLRMRANGGMQVIDSHAATVTDQYTVSEHTETATPTIKGSQALVKRPDMSRSQAVVSTLEDDDNQDKVINPHLSVGSKIVSTVLGKLSLGQRPILGEKTASIFEPRESIPQLNTPDGARLDAFASLAMRHPEPLMIADVISRELSELSGIEMPIDYLNLVKEYAGNPYVRAAALGDRKYHAMAVHVSQSGCSAIRFAPMTSKSFGALTPPNWQSLRTGVRSIGHLNISLDPTLRRSKEVLSGDFRIGYDIAKDTLAPFLLCRNSITVMKYLQASSVEGSDNGRRGMLVELTKKRIFADSLTQQGGIRDLMRYNEVKAELDEIWEDEVGIDEGEAPTHHLKLNLGHARAFAQSAIVRPAFVREVRRTSDDISMVRGQVKPTLKGYTHESLASSGFDTVLSIGALLRYGVSICYMGNKPEVRLFAAMYVKQWNIAQSGKTRREGVEMAKNDEVVATLAYRLLTNDVLKLMLDLLPYSSLQTLDNVLRKLRVTVPQKLFHSTKSEVFQYAMREFIKSSRASNERYVLRKLCGRIIHAGMSDSGLMFSISTKVRGSVSMSDIMVEHIRYKIGVWTSNYKAQLMLRSEEVETEGTSHPPEWYTQTVIWQQKLKALKCIEVVNRSTKIHVIAKDSSLCKMMMDSYIARYDSVAAKLRSGGEKAFKTGYVFSHTAEGDPMHPWGDRETQEDMATLMMSGLQIVLDYLDSKQKSFWTVQPRELFTLVNDTVSKIIYGIQTAIEDVDLSYSAYTEGTGDDHVSALPDNVERAVSAKFQFSLADPPKAIDPTKVDNSGSTVRGKVPPIRNPAGPPSSRMVIGPGGISNNPVAKAMMLRKALAAKRAAASAHPRRKMATITQVLSKSSVLERLQICRWLAYLVKCPVEEVNTVEILPKEYHCYPDDTAFTTALILKNYASHRKRKLARAAEGVGYDDDME